LTVPRIGHGLDVHALVPSRPLWLGGVEIPSDRGLAGHSDGDALLHAVSDAILGAIGAGDLGSHFPSSDPALRGVDSAVLLAQVCDRMCEAGFRIGNVDATVVAQAPRLSPYQTAMRERVAELLGVESGAVNVKLKSADRLGALGREEGIAAHAVVLLVPGAGDDSG
jgi:2-C-methyl-D-erythritol 2,4-cyclodiphosphate synthase